VLIELQNVVYYESSGPFDPITIHVHLQFHVVVGVCGAALTTGAGAARPATPARVVWALRPGAGPLAIPRGSTIVFILSGSTR
jgi:hypothetical protein